MEIIQFLSVLGCFFGWGFSTFIMGYLGKLISLETALFYNFMGMGLFNLLITHKITIGWSQNHFWALLNGVAFTMADYAYYKVLYFYSYCWNRNRYTI